MICVPAFILNNLEGVETRIASLLARVHARLSVLHIKLVGGMK
jgi:hypothetical protein